MKKILFAIFLLVICVIYFADQITGFAITKAFQREGFAVSKLSLSWNTDGLSFQEFNIEKNNDKNKLSLKISDLTIKVDFSTWNYSVFIDNFNFKYSSQNSGQGKINENDEIILPLSKMFGIGLDRLSFNSSLIDIQYCNYRAMVEMGGKLIIGSEQADMEMNGELKFSENDILLSNVNMIMEFKIFDNSLTYQGTFNEIQLDLHKSSFKKPFEIISGKLHFEGKTKKNLATNLLTKFTHGKAIFDSMKIDDINLQNTIKLQNNELWIYSNIIVGNTGEPINASDIKLELIYQDSIKDLVKIKKAEMKLADGHISIDPTDVDLSNKSNIKVTIKEIDLNKLAEIAKIDGLSVKGKISGWLDLGYDNNKIKIFNSRIQSTSNGGVIQYNPLDKTMLTNIANYIKLPPGYWGNFIFQDISVNAKNEDTKTVFQIKILGNNPKYFNGRKVNLNSKISLPVISLLKSWWIGEEIGLDRMKSIKK